MRTDKLIYVIQCSPSHDKWEWDWLQGLLPGSSGYLSDDHMMTGPFSPTLIKNIRCLKSITAKNGHRNKSLDKVSYFLSIQNTQEKPDFFKTNVEKCIKQICSHHPNSDFSACVMNQKIRLCLSFEWIQPLRGSCKVVPKCLLTVV